jgi:signal transduction histidine kinase
MSVLSPEIKEFGKALDQETALGRLVTISKAFTFVWLLIISGRLFINFKEQVPVFSNFLLLSSAFTYHLIFLSTFIYLERIRKSDPNRKTLEKFTQLLGVLYLPCTSAVWSLDYALAPVSLQSMLATPAFFVPLIPMYLLYKHKAFVLSMYVCTSIATIYAMSITSNPVVLLPAIIGLNAFIYLATRERNEWIRSSFEKEKQFELIQKQNLEISSQLSEREHVLKILSHDLQNQIQVSTWSLLELQKKNIVHIKDPLDRMEAAMLNQRRILSTARLHLSYRLGNLKFSKRVFDPFEMVKDCQRDMELFFRRKNIALIINNEFPTELGILADGDCLRYNVLSNILSNAIKFSPKNDTITVNLFVRNGSGFIEISDKGEGVNQETVAEIRRSKELVSTIGTSGEAGSGFGLSIVSTAVTLMGCELNFASVQAENEGDPHGTTVSIRFPIETMKDPLNQVVA